MKIGYNIYATQAEGGIQNDGRVRLVGIGDLSRTEILNLCDWLQEIARVMAGSKTNIPRVGYIEADPFTLKMNNPALQFAALAFIVLLVTFGGAAILDWRWAL